jgi:hypothetical protein
LRWEGIQARVAPALVTCCNPVLYNAAYLSYTETYAGFLRPKRNLDQPFEPPAKPRRSGAKAGIQFEEV